MRLPRPSAVLVALALATPARAADLHVSPAGDDANPGTADRPLKSPNLAVVRARAGDTVVLAPGRYELAPLTVGRTKVEAALRVVKPNLTVRAADPGPEWAGRPVWEWPADKQPLLVGAEGAGAVVFARAGGTGLTLRNLRITGEKTLYGFATLRGGSGATIEGCEFFRTGADALKFKDGAKGCTVRRCYVHDTGANAGKKSANGLDNVGCPDLLVEGCRFENIPSVAAYHKGGAARCVFRDCTAKNCKSGFWLGGSTDNAFLVKTDNPGKHENLDGVIANCTVDGCDNAGIVLWSAKNPQVYGCKVVNVAGKAQGALTLMQSRNAANLNMLVADNVFAVAAGSTRPALDVRAGATAAGDPVRFGGNRWLAASAPDLAGGWFKAFGDGTSTAGTPDQVPADWPARKAAPELAPAAVAPPAGTR